MGPPARKGHGQASPWWNALARATRLLPEAGKAREVFLAYKFRFYRMGGLDQVAIESGEDLAHLHELDPKLWVALSCPVKGLEISERTLSLLDLDRDGRVRVPEILAALRWCEERLRDPRLAHPLG